MSTSLQNVNDRFFPGVGNYTLADPHMQAIQGAPVPVYLSNLGDRAAGWQKEYLVEKTSQYDQTYSRPQYLPWEKVNDPPRFDPPAIKSRAEDPFGTAVWTRSGGYGDSYCSCHLNQWAQRRNPNVAERVRWKAVIRSYLSTAAATTQFAALCATYTGFSNQVANEVVWSQTKRPYWELDVTIDLPANGHPAILFSLQHTVGPTSSGSTIYGCEIHDWEATYV